MQFQSLTPDRLVNMFKVLEDLLFHDRQGLGEIACRHLLCPQKLNELLPYRLFHGRTICFICRSRVCFHVLLG